METTLIPTDVNSALLLLLVIARAGGIFLFAPVFSERVVPVRLRAALAVTVGFALVSRVAQPAAIPTDALGLALGVAGELAVGAALGYAARLVIVGIELGALHAGRQMGIGLAEAFNPGGSDASGSVQRLMRLFAIVVFLAIGGHRAVLSALVETFGSVPVLSFAPSMSLLDAVVSLLGASFELAVKVAAPVVVALVLAAMAMGLLQRTMPQLNAFSVGFGVRTMVGLALLAASLVVVVPLVGSAWPAMLRTISTCLGAAK